MNELLESAKKYANMGIAVFPLKPKSKVPATENGFKDATTMATDFLSLIL